MRPKGHSTLIAGGPWIGVSYGEAGYDPGTEYAPLIEWWSPGPGDPEARMAWALEAELITHPAPVLVQAFAAAHPFGLYQRALRLDGDPPVEGNFSAVEPAVKQRLEQLEALSSAAAALGASAPLQVEGWACSEVPSIEIETALRGARRNLELVRFLRNQNATASDCIRALEVGALAPDEQPSTGQPKPRALADRRRQLLGPVTRALSLSGMTWPNIARVFIGGLWCEDPCPLHTKAYEWRPETFGDLLSRDLKRSQR